MVGWVWLQHSILSPGRAAEHSPTHVFLSSRESTRLLLHMHVTWGPDEEQYCPQPPLSLVHGSAGDNVASIVVGAAEDSSVLAGVDFVRFASEV